MMMNNEFRHIHIQTCSHEAEHGNTSRLFSAGFDRYNGGWGDKQAVRSFGTADNILICSFHL